MNLDERDARTIQLTGEDGMQRLRDSSVLVVGVGGVGSYAAEAIARAGIGRIEVMDGDVVSVSNMNRQLVALASTVGRNKAEVMAERIKDINPAVEVAAIPEFYGKSDTEELVPVHQNDTKEPTPVYQSDTEELLPEERSRRRSMVPTLRQRRITIGGTISPASHPIMDITQYDWIIDAIDDVNAKVELIKSAQSSGVNIVSAMGAAGKFETHFKTADISKTSMCPLAKVMRRRLRAEGIEHLPVVYSEEKPVPRDGELGSMSYVPGSMGLELAGYVIKQIIERSRI